MPNPKWEDTTEIIDAPKWDDTTEIQESQEPSTLESVGQSAEAVLPMVAQGATMGFAEEAGAGVAAAGDWLRRKLGIETSDEELNRKLQEQGFKGDIPTIEDKDIVSQYQQFRDPSREYLKQLHEQAPITSTVSELAGGLVVPGGAIGAAKGANLATKVLKGGATAGLAGGAYGAGSSEADLTKGEVGKLVEDTATSAAIGAGMGAGFPLAGAGINKIGEKITDWRNDSIILDRLLELKNRARDNTLKTGQKELQEQILQARDLGEELINLEDKIGEKIYEPMQGIISRIKEGVDVTDDLVKLKNRIKNDEFPTNSEEAKRDAINALERIEKRIPKEEKVIKSVEEQALEKSEKQRKKVLEDFQAKKKILEEQNLSEIEKQKALDKVTKKAEQKAADKTRQSEILGEAPLASSEESVSGIVPNYGKAEIEGQRAIVPEYTTGKTLSTPIKETKPLDIPDFTQVESQPQFERAIFRNKKTGETFETPFSGKDTTEEVIGNKTLTPEELLNEKKLFGKLEREAQTTTDRKISGETKKIYENALQGKMLPEDVPAYKEVNAKYREMVTAFDSLNTKIRSIDTLDKEKAAKELGKLFTNLGDVRNISSQMEYNTFLRKLEEIAPNEIKPLKDKIKKLSDDIAINQLSLGIDPTMSEKFGRLLGGAINWAMRGMKYVGKLESKVSKPSKFTQYSNEKLANMAQEQLAKGNTSRANFLKNLSEVTNEKKKQALLFTASQNANLNGLFDEEEPEE